ncbi:MAG: hypothetical protein O3B65_02980 [Chloroflexi bacterium]|nr:hypothetical protein [Chloroflexota bacterium]
MVTQQETPSITEPAIAPSEITDAPLLSDVATPEAYVLDDQGQVVSEGDGSAVELEELPSATEAKPAGQPVEPPVAEAPAPVSITDTPEYRNLQSSFDRRIATVERELRESQRATEQARAQVEVDAQVEAHRRNLQDRYERLGVAPEDYAELVQESAGNYQKALVGSAEAQRQQAAAVQNERQQAFGTLTDWAGRLKTEHNLPDGIVESLRKVAALGVVNLDQFVDDQGQPSERFSVLGQTMQSIAEDFANTVKATTTERTVEARRAAVPAGGPENNFDSGGPQAGTDTDDQFLVRFANGETDDMGRASEILRKRGLQST